jgi:excisionase family DNA binding protein
MIPAELRATVEQQQHEADEGFTTVDGAAKFLALCRMSIYRLMETGQLAFVKFGRARRIPWTSLKKYARELLEQGHN